MCYQVRELYTHCKCIYYDHAVDKCASYGRHGIERKVVYVGYACSLHYGYGTADFPQPSVETLPRKSPIDTSESLLDHSDADSVDESIFSENENCGESSATSISPDTIGLIFENLLNYNDLRYLWPQFIFLEEEQARPQERIGKLLRLYAHRLKKLAKASRLDDVPQAHQRLELEAARFVRRSVSNLSQRIVEAHQEYVRWRPDIQPEVLHRGNRRVWSRPEDDEIDEDDDIDNEISDIAVAKTFLFETEPIRILEATVKTVVRPEVSTTNEWMVIRSLASLLDQSLELVDPPAVGTSRIRWTCSCGEQLYDDFIETQPGGLKQLRNELRIYGKDYDPFIGPSTLLAPEPLDDSGSAAANGPRFLGPLKKVTQWSNTGYTRVVNLFNKTRLPRFRQEEWQTKELGTCNNTTAIVPGANTDHNFLLLCIPYMRMGTKLSQSEVCRINSDQEFVKLLRQRYVAQRKQSTTAIWKLLRKVCSIEFVKFETYTSGLADIQSCPSLPPDTREYEFAHPQAGVIPPIGPNHLTHLFEHPDHAEVTPVLFRRVPRKLRAQLQVCPINGSVGWGLRLVEGMRWGVVFAYGFVGFMVCLIISVVWSVARHDVQGGFAIGGFLLAFLMFCGGMVQAVVVG